MTKPELEQIKKMKREIKVLEEEIKMLPMTTDCVKGSMNVFPYIERKFTISGVDIGRSDQLRRKLRQKRDHLQQELERMEDWLDNVNNPEMRVILRLRYRKGLTWQQIAFEIGHYDEQYPRKKHNHFLKYEKYEN